MVLDSAKRALDWLLTIQKPSGGWQSGYIQENKAEIVFNTAQVVRGMIKGYHYFEDLKYLKAAVAACRWLCDIQNENGTYEGWVTSIGGFGEQGRNSCQSPSLSLPANSDLMGEVVCSKGLQGLV